MTRRVLLYPGEDGFIVAEVPSLPGCISQGRTRDEALVNVHEAIGLHEEPLRERGEPLPEDRVELVEVAAGANCRWFQAPNVLRRLAESGLKSIASAAVISF